MFTDKAAGNVIVGIQQVAPPLIADLHGPVGRIDNVREKHGGQDALQLEIRCRAVAGNELFDLPLLSRYRQSRKRGRPTRTRCICSGDAVRKPSTQDDWHLFVRRAMQDKARRPDRTEDRVDVDPAVREGVGLQRSGAAGKFSNLAMRTIASGFSASLAKTRFHCQPRALPAPEY